MSAYADAVGREEGFSLVVGGPLYQLFLRTHLARPPIEFVYRRIIAAILLTWIPLAVLTAAEGTFYRGVQVPFLSDLGNLRFLIILPILIGGEPIVHRRIRVVVEQFRERSLVAPTDQKRFESIINAALRLRNSVVAEILLIVLAYTLGHWVWHKYGSLHVATWYATPDKEGAVLTGAGYWLLFVSLPVIRFILLRWYFRLFIWYVLLWRVSRLRLQLNALHPDRAGGLGFLSTSIAAFMPVLVAQSCFLSAQIGNEILQEHATLPQFKFLIAGFLAFLILTISIPLVFFSFKLHETKLAGTREYGVLANKYVREFHQKWIDNPDVKEELLGAADIQSLADLANSFEVVRGMRLVPLDRAAFVRIVVALIIPLLPLALTMFSAEEILQRVLKLLT